MEKLLHQYMKAQGRLETLLSDSECDQKEEYLIKEALRYCECKGNSDLKNALDTMDLKVREKFCDFYRYLLISGSSIDCFVDLLFGTQDSAVNMTKIIRRGQCTV